MVVSMDTAFKYDCTGYHCNLYNVTQPVTDLPRYMVSGHGFYQGKTTNQLLKNYNSRALKVTHNSKGITQVQPLKARERFLISP